MMKLAMCQRRLDNEPDTDFRTHVARGCLRRIAEFLLFPMVSVYYLGRGHGSQLLAKKAADVYPAH